MKNNSEVSYLKIGIFLLVGFSMIIAALLIFGSNKLFQRTIYIETYFEESVQGISEGYPVKYRGLQIGYVKKIALTSEIYKNTSLDQNQEHNRSIYVLLAITSKILTAMSTNDFRDFLTREIASGLRVKIMPQGITGTTYIELNYVDPKNNPPLVITWQPRYFYVPSTPGMLTRLSDSAQHILKELKDVDFKQVFDNVNKLTTSLGFVSEKASQVLDKSRGDIDVTLHNFRAASDNLRVLSQQLKLYPSQLIFSGSPPPVNPSKL
ncbi:MAG: MlaD family protein [Gammaproteobacteria bacterium]|jgi:phospholipid/cholesterol/gamma-HCH transport system substrate-binding protein/paraquat-inducible protein B